MAKDDRPTAADKGKGKADDVRELNGDKKDSKDKPLVNGKKDEEPQGEELSEEDQQLKNELEMLVERLQEPDTSLYKPAVDAIKTFIKTSTSSMTAVPKPLKFLRPHYDELAALHGQWPAGDDKDSLADMLSVLGMTYGDEEKLETLKYRLLTKSDDLGSWGHEYIRHLALEIGQEYQNRLTDDKEVQDLIDLSLSLVPYFLRHNAEADAVDLLSELEMIEEIPKFVDENTYARVSLYMVSMVNLLTYPEDHQFLRTAHDIYLKYNKLTQAIVIAIRLNDLDLIKSDFNATTDKAIKKQMAFLVAQQQIWLDLPIEDEDDEQLAECLNNTQLHNHFKALGKELNILDPKLPEDIYKSHLESRGAGLTNVDSARQNLSSAFVNAFTNAGFSNDKMMLVEGDKGPWVWKTKDDGMLSTTASMGMLLQWNVDDGLDKIDKFTYAEETQIKAGAALAIGILNSGVRSESEPALALLSGSNGLESTSVPIKVASIMGLGLSYAGSCKEELLELLLPIVEDSALDMQISAMAALSLGLIFVGSSNHDVSEAIATTLMDEERQKHLKSKWSRFMALGLALLYFGRQEDVDVILDILKVIDHPMAKATSVLASVCAWAGTGTVLKMQELLHICNEQIEDDNEEKKGDELVQSYAVLGLSLIAMGEDIGQDMVLRQFGHLMHYGAANIRKAVPLAMGLVSPSNPQMKVYDTLSRYSHDNDNDVAINSIFAMGLLGAGTNNARLAQLLRQLASYYHRDQNSLFMVRIAQGLLHMGKGSLSVSPFHTDRQVLSRVAAAGLLTVLVAMIDAKDFILADSHYLLYFLVTAMHPRFLVTLDEDLKPLTVNVRVGQAVDVVAQAGRPKTITGWQTQSTPVLLSYGERAELEDEEYISLSSTLEGLVILRKNPEWENTS
ncbi:26S proteasome regulatory subunit rpn-1 [Polytolypa hystricis UAMH7299]|uniref:26S proteasome regulatory subunit RPN1 n=1 Tax=Polytolypa hystricis (strain UAMH7299) TaxID=1447883 RepID=A0A2B7Z162_POLH7|nr:26S proteasome regulatory subunit rpn-1 [Polytolypa hystricis UAMH7299]